MTTGIRKQASQLRMVVLIVAVVCACLAVIAYVQVTVRQVEEELPLRVMGEKRAMERVARNFYEFLAVTEAARIHQTSGNLESIREHLRVVQNDLRTMRERYSFDTLIGASALHAVMEPAVEDIQLWLHKGFGDLPPTSPVVLQLIATRARDTLSKIFDKTTEADRLAHEILERQTNTLRRLRSQLIVPLAALGVLAAGIIWLAIGQQRVLKLQSEAEAEAQRAQAQLRAAIDNISEGFALYDDTDALVISNVRYRELLHGNDTSIMRPGTKFEMVVRQAAEGGLIADAQDNLESWLKERVRRHKNPGQPHVQRYSSGRWIQVSERKTSDGGTVAVYTDIS
ncbi:MAG: PAS-domain containing protein, partial [Hyphomicrobiaceae bacterium]